MISSLHRPTLAKVDLSAISENIEQVVSHIPKQVKTFAVVKANAYGHGAVEVAKHVSKQVDGFCVSNLDEALELRQAGLEQPILILGVVLPDEVPLAIQENITLTVASLEWLEMVKDQGLDLTGLTCHIKVDSGMGRIGVRSQEDTDSLIAGLKSLGADVEGIFTHFACADEEEKTSARHQKELFDQFVSKIEEKGIEIPVKHVSNSAAIMDLCECRMDMVRSGIITYGLYPSEEVDKSAIDLKPALSLISHVIHVKEVGPGEGVSYGSTFVTDRKTRIATIPVGYADGYPRALSSRGRVIIRGQYAPIIGRICMDQFMVDVTDIEGVSVMDRVTLVGTDGDKNITVEEAADLAGSFNYEFVCGIGKRVPRVYFQDGKAKEAVDYLED